MRLIITGGAGFVGQKLATKLLSQGHLNLDDNSPVAIDKLVIFDQHPPKGLELNDARLEVVVGDLTAAGQIDTLMAEPADLIFHLSAIPSGGAEKAFDRGFAVNLDATRALLEAARQQGNNPRLVFTSTTAVFGGDLPEIVPDEWAPTPTNSYGIAKAMTELLLNDFSRRGFLDGRTVRLPTVVVRGDTPNAATSTFASSIIREPLKGERAVCPVTADTVIWILSPDQTVTSLIRAAELPAGSLGDNRIITLPGLSVSVGEMVAALGEIAGQATVELIDWKHDPFIQRIVGSWPTHFAARRALALGFKADESIESIIRAHIAA